MFLWPIIQVCLLIFIGLFVITQIIIPSLIGKPLFWFFRKPDSELIEAQRELYDLNIAEEIKEIKEKINEKKNQ